MDRLIAETERALAELNNQRASARTEQRTMAEGLAESASFTEAQQARFDELTTNVRGLAEQITTTEGRLADLRAASEDEQRISDAARSASPSGAERRDQAARVGAEPRTYTRETARTGTSFFSDMYRSQFGGDLNARARIERHMQEARVEGESQERALTTGSLNSLVPPVYLTEEAALLARAGRPTANVVRHEQLPDTGMSIIIPRGTTGTSEAVQATQNANVSSTDMAITDLTVPVVTIAGQQDVSRQALERGSSVDTLVFADLAAAYAVALDNQVLNGTGASGQMLGILNTAGITTMSAFAAAVAADTFYRKLAGAITAVQTSRYLAPSGIIVHPRRWGWLTAQLDSSNRPLVVPNPNGPFNAQGHFNEPIDTPSAAPAGWILGVPIYTDANIPTAVGTGPEDQVIVTRLADLILWEDGDGTPTELRFEQTLGNQLTVKLVAYGYAAFTAGRYPAATAVIGGNAGTAGFGLVAPTF